MLVTPLTPKTELHVVATAELKGMAWREKWRTLRKWSSMRLAGGMALLYIILPVAADQWPNAAPFVMKFIPHGDAALSGFIGSVLYILARISKFELVRKNIQDGNE